MSQVVSTKPKINPHKQMILELSPQNLDYYLPKRVKATQVVLYEGQDQKFNRHVTNDKDLRKLMKIIKGNSKIKALKRVSGR